MSQGLLGSLTSAIPLLNLSQPKGGGGGLIDQIVSPIASIATTATTAASKVVDQFLPPVAKNALNALTGGLSLDGGLPGGLKVEVNVLKSVVAGQSMDPKTKANIQNALDEVKAGKPLSQSLSPLSESEKKQLADTIGNAGFEPPECLTPYLSNKSQGDSGRMDCALKNVEVYEEKGYGATEASSLMRTLPLASLLLGH